MTKTFIVNWQDACVEPKTRIAFELAVRNRYVDLCGTIEKAEAYFKEPDRKTNPKSHYNLRFNQAVNDAVAEFKIPPTIAKERLHLAARFE